MSRKIFIAFSILIIVIGIISGVSLAKEVNPTEYEDVGAKLTANRLTKIGGWVFNAVAIVAGGIAVIGITILGIRYMLSSADGKADIKKKLIPFLIGAALVFGVSFVMNIIFNMVDWL